MTVDIKNVVHAKGWGEYVLEKGERQGASLVTGDIELGDSILNGLSYKSGNAVHFVISFADEDNIDPVRGRKIALEFMKEFMHGFYNDEYHMDMVEHTDTDHLHYHVRIPKVNLLTNTQLKLYYHASDLGFKKAVIDDVAYRHNLVTGEAYKNTLPNVIADVERIHIWRKEHQQKPFELNKKKGRAQAENSISQYIAAGVKEGLIHSFEEVKKELQALDLEIVNEGYDQGKGFHYLTIENESGKVRLKGEIYSAGFYRLKQEDRAENIQSNRGFTTRAAELRKSGADIKQALSTERNKRLKFIDRQYGQARKRAYQTHHERDLAFDRADDRRERNANTRADASVEREYKHHTQRDTRGEKASLAYDEKDKPRAEQDASQTVADTNNNRYNSGALNGSRDLGSSEATKQSTSSPTGVGRDDSTNKTHTGQIHQESMEQWRGGTKRTQSMERSKERTLDYTIRKNQLKEHNDTTRRDTDAKTQRDERDAQKRARDLRRKLEENSARLRRELQDASDARRRSRAKRREYFNSVFQISYRAERRDYQAIKGALSSRFSREAVATNIAAIFSEFGDKVNVFKSSIDRGNARLFTVIRTLVKETIEGVLEKSKDTKKEVQAKKEEQLSRGFFRGR